MNTASSQHATVAGYRVPKILLRFCLCLPETESSSTGFGSGARKFGRTPNLGLGPPLGLRGGRPFARLSFQCRR